MSDSIKHKVLGSVYAGSVICIKLVSRTFLLVIMYLALTSILNMPIFALVIAQAY